MTCEVAVMNKRGIALAADSAVTMVDGSKVYNSAEKLFQLARAAPVGIMTYGAGELMGVPLETVIAGYTRKLGDRTFDTLAEYLADFVAFIEGARSMFPEAVQRDRLRYHARMIWKCFYAEPLADFARKRRRKNGNRHAVLNEIIQADQEAWQQYPPLEGFDDDFADRVLAKHRALFDEVETEIFGTTEQPEEIRQGLRSTLRHFLTRGAFPGDDDSGLVIAGMGEAEFFPSFLHCRIGTITLDRLKILKLDHATITHDHLGCVKSFAQGDLIDTIIEGIHPRLAKQLPELIEKSIHKRPQRVAERDHAAASPEEPGSRFAELLRAEIAETQVDPFMSAVAALPRHDLAALAEALVNLTAFRVRMSADERETVVGPIDVAILSKGAGFVWAKRKGLPK